MSPEIDLLLPTTRYPLRMFTDHLKQIQGKKVEVYEPLATKNVPIGIGIVAEILRGEHLPF